MRILNLTQHPATEEQRESGVFEPQNKELVKELLTFSEVPTSEEISLRARALRDVALAHKAARVMIGGALYLMPHLENALVQEGILPLYSFTKRETVEQVLEDGQVKKTAIFKHIGWVEAQDLYKS